MGNKKRYCSEAWYSAMRHAQEEEEIQRAIEAQKKKEKSQ